MQNLNFRQFMTDFDIEDFCKESSINNEDYWFLKLNQMEEKSENTSLSNENSDDSNTSNE